MQFRRETFLSFIIRRIIGPGFMFVGLILSAFGLVSFVVTGETMVNGQPTDDLGFAAISIILPLIVAGLGVLAMKAKPEYDGGSDDPAETESFGASESGREKSLALIVITRTIGPVMLVGGFVVGMYMLESEVMPIAIEANKTGAAPEFGFETFKVFAAGAVALVGLRLIKMKTLPRAKGKD